MKLFSASQRSSSLLFSARRDGRAGIILLVLVSFALGLGASLLWFSRGAKPVEAAKTFSLSDTTLATLANLGAPVEIRYYAILNDPNISDAQHAFAGRVDQLLSEYEREGNGKVTVVRIISDADADKASGDGITPFNQAFGETCYLGISISQGQQRESLPMLVADWETALESDLTRVLQRVARPKPSPVASVDTSRPDPAATKAVRAIIADPAAVSLEEGTQILQEAALKEFKDAVVEMDERLKAAQERYEKVSQPGNFAADQEAALKELKKVQSEQTERLKEIAARAQAQLAAFQQMKK